MAYHANIDESCESVGTKTYLLGRPIFSSLSKAYKTYAGGGEGLRPMYTFCKIKK